MLNKGSLRSIVLFIMIFWLIVFILLPHLLIFIVSFLENDENNFFSFIFTLENYSRIFSSTYLHIFYNSLIIASIVTVLCLVAGYPCAYMLSCSTPFKKNMLILLLIIPFWTSSLVRTYSLMILLRTKGVINELLLWIEVIDVPLELLYNWTAIILGLVYSLLPFMVLPLYSVLEKLENKYIEAAQDLGANRFNLFFKIIIPLSMPGIVAGCMLVFLPALGMFYVPDLLGGAKDILLGNLIRNQFFVAHNWPFGAALSILFTVVIAFMLIAHFKTAKYSNKQVEI